MWYYILKTLLSAIIIVTVSEIAKRTSLFGGLIASLPLTSILAMIWLYIDTQDVQRVIALSKDIFWLVFPSLILFLTLPILLKKGVNFYLALIISSSLMMVFYAGTIYFIRNLL